MLSTLECVLIRPIAEANQMNLPYSLCSPANTWAQGCTCRAKQRVWWAPANPPPPQYKPPVLCGSAVHFNSVNNTYLKQSIQLKMNVPACYCTFIQQSTSSLPTWYNYIHTSACFGVVYIILFSLAGLLIWNDALCTHQETADWLWAANTV